MLRLSFGHPDVASFNFWGLSDRDIWLSCGGLVDKDYNPKPIFTRLHKLIREEWMTRNLSVQSDELGMPLSAAFWGNTAFTLGRRQGRNRTSISNLAAAANGISVFSCEQALPGAPPLAAEGRDALRVVI